MSQARTMVYHSPSRHLHPSHSSPGVHDSPSRQLLGDLEADLEKLRIYEQDVQKVHLFQRNVQQSSLDAYEAKVARKQLAELDAAVARNEAVRRDAEAELVKWKRQVEEEQRRRDAEARRIQEEESRRRAEEQRIARENAERQAADQRARAAREKQEIEWKVREAAAEKAQMEAEKKAQMERESRARKEAEVQAQQAEVQKQNAEAAKTAQPSSISTNTEKETRHARYLEIHQNLKSFRKHFVTESKKDPNAKAKSGDIRRKLRQYVGQLLDLKTGNISDPREAQELKSSNLKVVGSRNLFSHDSVS